MKRSECAANDPLISICHNSWAFDYRAMEGSYENEIIN